jgi:release factor glutamine methyltransferase
VHLHHGDFFAPLTGVVAPASVDVVVSNPPYVRRDEEFDPEILFEPSMALFADDVPSVYRRLAESAAPIVRPGGKLLLELPGCGSDLVVAALRESPEWGGLVIRPDLGGHSRVASATRSD